MSPRLVLASTSESRRRMLQAAGLVFEAIAPAADEEALKRKLAAEKTSPDKMAVALAELKAMSVSQSIPDAIVLGADQLLVCEDRLYVKAHDKHDAKRILRELRGRKHELVTAAVLAKANAIVWRQVETATLWMREFSDAFLDDYLEKEGDAALAIVGGYRIEGRGAQLFRRVEGDHFTIQGLPLLAVMEALRAHGVIAR